MITDAPANKIAIPIKCHYSVQEEDISARQQVYDKLCREHGTTKVN